MMVSVRPVWEHIKTRGGGGAFSGVEKKQHRSVLVKSRGKGDGEQKAGRALTFRKFPEKMDIGSKKMYLQEVCEGGGKIRVILHFRENPGLWWGIYGKMDKILVI